MLFHSVLELLMHQAQQHSDDTAIIGMSSDIVTFQELANSISSIYETLSNYQVTSSDRVVIVMPNGPTMAMTNLGVMAHAVCCPLNPEYQAHEFEFFLEDIAPKLIITSKNLNATVKSVAEKFSIPVKEIEDSDLKRNSFNTTPLNTSKINEGVLTSTALILYTSGTTSKPKMVSLSHENILASISNITKSLSLSQQDRCLNMMPLFHVGGLIDLLLAPLSVGGSVICSGNFSSPDFFKYLNTYNPTWYQAPPAMLQDIVEYLDIYPSTEFKHNLRFIRSASAALSADTKLSIEKSFAVAVIEIYGMTEACGLISGNPLEPDLQKTGSVGLPVNPDNLAIINEQDERQPVNSSGEIVIRGTHVINSYSNVTDENNNCFYDGWFKTGDMGYLDNEGYLYLTGRIKDIINRGGEKFSPAEIDKILLEHPHVTQAVTFALPDNKLGEEVVAAITLSSSSSAETTELRKYVSKKVAYYKVPKEFFIVESLPKSASGKISRQQLTEIYSKQRAEQDFSVVSDIEYIEPTSEISIIIANMWEELLHVEKIGTKDNFFALGGDSLKAATFLNSIQDEWGSFVYVSAVFEAPTIDEFEAYLEDQYPDLIKKMLGQAIANKSEVTDGISESDIIATRKKIQATINPDFPSNTKKNPSAIFILSPPRSGSTLLRAILGGHSGLFSPPELYLLSSSTLQDRANSFSESHKFMLEGNIRALMQIHTESVEEATERMSELEGKNLSTQDYYALLQGWIGDKVLVDKTPAYALNKSTLECAEKYFDNPLYIRLNRHPYGMIRSFEEAKLEQLWYSRLVGKEADINDSPYKPHQLAELVWFIINENITQFLGNVPANRQYEVKFEDLVEQPEISVAGLCNFLGITPEPLMLKPQAGKSERMTDGIHKESRMIGDMKFHLQTDINSDASGLWKSYYQNDFLCDQTLSMAKSLGYEETVSSENEIEELIF